MKLGISGSNPDASLMIAILYPFFLLWSILEGLYRKICKMYILLDIEGEK